MKNKKVYIIIINVGNWQDTIECINSIFINRYTNYQLIIIENSKDEISFNNITGYLRGEYISNNKNNFYKIESNDVAYKVYSREEIEKKSLKCSYYHVVRNYYLNYPVVIIRNKKTSGFSENNNLGLKYALVKNDFEYIWILNNDTVIDNNALSALVNEIKKDKKIGVVGSVLKYYDRPDTLQLMGGGHFFKNIGVIKSLHKNADENIINKLNKSEIVKKLNMISGASFFINKSVINKVGLMDEDYFLYGDDLDYSFRISTAGWERSIAMNSVVYHKHNTTTKQKSLQFYYYHNSRSSVLFSRKHFNILFTITTTIFWLVNTLRKTSSKSVLLSSFKGVIAAWKYKI